jgi:hypothetical protein
MSCGAVEAFQSQPDGRLLVTTRPCTICYRPGQLADVDPRELAAWYVGVPIQDAMPGRSKPERELLQTGLHAECFGRLAPPAATEETP